MATHEACSICNQMFLDLNVFGIAGNEDTFHRSHQSTRTYKSIQLNAELGCLMCAKLWAWFKLETSLWDDFNLGLDKGHEHEVVFTMDFLRLETHRLCISLAAASDLPGEENWLALELLADPENPAAQYTSGRMFKGDLGSDRTFEIAKQWLDDCIHNHDVCLASQTNALPARLLDLQTESGTPRLINCGGMEAKTTSYACLSYCWGQEPQPLLLTIENLSTLKMQIPLDSLPKTLKDAITTTIRLGLRYLWVDALCIVQDWDEDKATEISRMGQIYTNAHVTIAAASEASCDAGFLSERRAWWTERDGPPIKLPYLCPDNSIGTVYLVRGGEASIQEPLHLRAWTLQEHLLSRRILFYGKQQLYWICCSERLLKDSGSVYDHAIARFAPLRSLLLTERPSEEQNNVGNGDSHVRAAWKNLVEQYSGRAQSVSVDRLHALLGVLPRFQAHMRQQYVAGYWPPWLYDDLLWRRVGDALDRPSRRYPSWSWLSIDSAVKLDVVDNLSKKTRLAEVTGCDVEPIDPGNPYGELSSGILTIRGHCIAIRPNWEDLTLFFDDPDPHSTRFLHPSVNKMTFDTSDYLKEPDCNHTSLFGTGVIWCLSMMKAEVSNKVTDEWVGHAIWGLLLADVGDGNMKRVGCFTSCTGREERLLVGEQVSVRLI